MNAVAPELELSAQRLRRVFDRVFASPSPERPQDLEPLLMLRIGSTAYALRVLDIAGLATARKIAAVATALPALLGLIAVRGTLFPAYSLEALLAHQPANGPPRWFALCGGADPVALGFAQLEGHVLLPRSAIFAAGDGEAPRRHVGELARVADEVRGVIDVPSLVEALRARVSADAPIDGLIKE